MPYKLSFFFPAGAVNIKDDGTVEMSVDDSKNLTSDELAAIGIMNEVIQRLKHGKFVRYDFNPTSFESETQLMKCEWLKSGNLKVHGPTDKEYHNVSVVADAIAEPRTFTCKKSLIGLLPRHRVRAGVSSGK